MIGRLLTARPARTGAIVGMGLCVSLVAASVTSDVAAEVAPDEPLTVSHDGVLFTPGSEVEVFTDIGMVVPGDVAAEPLWLRNETAEEGTLALHLVGVEATDPDLTEAVQVSVRDVDGRELGAATIAEASSSGGCASVSGQLALAPGEAVRLDVLMTVAPLLGSRPGEGGRDGASGRAGFQLRATLAETEAAGDGDGDGCGSPPGTPGVPPGAERPSEVTPAPGDLATTGGIVRTGAIAAGIVLFTAGTIFVLAARNFRRDRQ